MIWEFIIKKTEGLGNTLGVEVDRTARYGGSDVIEINQTIPTPTLTAGKVLVEIKATGINPIDWKIREVYMQQIIPLQFPSTLGMAF